MTRVWPARPPFDQVHPGLMRWCDWPLCPEWHVAMEPHTPGWIWTSSKVMLLCPAHAEAGHLPSYHYDREQKVTTAKCGCGWSEVPPGTSLNHVIEAWQVHALTVGR